MLRDLAERAEQPLFRGQSRPLATLPEQRLLPSIDRGFERPMRCDLVELERALSPSRVSATAPLQQLMWLQHHAMEHRATTRLLDWTESFEDAMRFAGVPVGDFACPRHGSPKHAQEPGAILCFDYGPVRRVMDAMWLPHRVVAEVGDRVDHERLACDFLAGLEEDWFVAIAVVNEDDKFPRMRGQRSVFTICGRRGVCHWSQIAELAPSSLRLEIALSSVLDTKRRDRTLEPCTDLATVKLSVETTTNAVTRPTCPTRYRVPLA